MSNAFPVPVSRFPQGQPQATQTFGGFEIPPRLL
jgi:hypothetical protein